MTGIVKMFADVSPPSDFTDHKLYSRDIIRVDQVEGALASKSLGGSGVGKFSKLSEAPDQRKPT